MKHPETMEVFMKHGMHCIGCMASHFEDLEQGCAAHGMDADSLVKELNEAAQKAGKIPASRYLGDLPDRNLGHDDFYSYSDPPGLRPRTASGKPPQSFLSTGRSVPAPPHAKPAFHLWSGGLRVGLAVDPVWFYHRHILRLVLLLCGLEWLVLSGLERHMDQPVCRGCALHFFLRVRVHNIVNSFISKKAQDIVNGIGLLTDLTCRHHAFCESERAWMRNKNFDCAGRRSECTCRVSHNKRFWQEFSAVVSG